MYGPFMILLIYLIITFINTSIYIYIYISQLSTIFIHFLHKGEFRHHCNQINEEDNLRK